ncbi:MAG: serine/threonine protein kinase, partial [Anaerolinea sp.]|nr:serine/threonine protein kinase [Anaerolinea sp.]
MDVGVEFSHYRVIEHIGRGGMADVWSARDKQLNRTVAVKTVARDLSQDLNPIKLFEREAKTIAGLEHPHILPIYEFGEYSGQLYIVMRYVSGGSLEDLLEEGPLPLDEVMRLARSIAQALDYAHANKVIHLDLKPSNILLDSYRLPYLADFGLATVLDPQGRAANPGSGTLLYMAPEQLTAEVLDHRADIYSFSILIFHMMTGQLPFDATIPLALKQLQLSEHIPDVDYVTPGLPATLNPVLRRGTEVDANKRPQALMEIVQALEAALNPARAATPLPTARPRPRPAQNVVDMDTRTDALEEFISGPLDNLVTRTAPIMDTSALDDLITGPVDNLISKKQDVTPIDGRTTRIDVGADLNLDNLISKPGVTPDEMARREALDIYTRARRAWAHGQGRFLLGITHFTLINDYYLQAETNKLELDEAGMQMLLRGALEYDHEIDAWWSKLDDENRRWVALHALRSENAPARVRAIQRLEGVADSEPPQIPKLVAQALASETNTEAKLAAIHLLEVRAKSQPNLPEFSAEAQNRRWTTQLRLAAANDWRPTVYSQDIDLLLAQLALDDRDNSSELVEETAARTIGRIRSTAAVAEIAKRQQNGEKGALRALAIIRDEAPSLPNVVSRQARTYAWLANSWRRVSLNPIQLVWRFVLAALGGALAFGGYAYAQLPGEAIFFAERLGKSFSTGATVGIFVGLVALLAGGIPERLRGFWPWWARLLLNLGLGLVSGALMWVVYLWFFLFFEPDNVPSLIIGGIGAALAFSVPVLFRVRGVVAVVAATVAFYLMMAIPWYLVIQFRDPTFATLLYTRPADPFQGTAAQHIDQFAP